MNRGYYGVALFEPKTDQNLGTILRSCLNFDAGFIYTIGNRYQHQGSDTVKASRHVPLTHFADTAAFLAHLPKDAELVCIEVDGEEALETFVHPERAIYVFGGEDRSVSEEIKSHGRTLRIDTNQCLNLAVAASVVMYDRRAKAARRQGR